MTVAIQGVDKVNVYVQGVNIKQALSAANETVNKGLYDPTTLSTVDADLATGNIKSGITIFGKAGSANVLDISDADALVADVKDPKTFYSVTGPRKTGTMPTVAIVAANDNYPAGYHAGDVGGLDAIDLDLASANIKSGVTIFGKAGAATVQDISAADAAVANVLSPKTFFSVTGAIKTGTMPTVALSAASNTYPAGYHVGAASLTAVDADLATGNIKSGITIFGVAGAATVQDISAANATVAQVLSANTFFSVTGAIKTGTMPTVALAANNSAYPAGYHAGAASLAAVDADLAVGNIKTGVNIFGYVGTYDTTASAPTAAQMISGRVAWANGAQITGTMPTVALDPAANAYPAGYHVGQVSLTAVDADLVAGNIKTGIVIFGVTGTYDTTGTPPVAGDIKTGKVCWANGAQITGTMSTVALDPALNSYPAGYHAGAASLTAVDADLVTGNIKSGITIFGVAGAATVQDISAADAAVANVLSPKTFFSVTGAIKTGTMATVALAANNTAYPAGYHAGAASLQAVDADLTPANIKTGVNIFGYVGTYAPTLAEDITGSAGETALGTTVGAYRSISIAATSELTIATVTTTFAAGSMAVGCGAALVLATTLSTIKLRLYMGGVQVAESAYVSNTVPANVVLVATRALSGSQICKLVGYNEAVAARVLHQAGILDSKVVSGSIGVGSIKQV